MHRLLNIESTKIHKPNIDSSRLKKVTHVYSVIRSLFDISGTKVTIKQHSHTQSTESNHRQ